MSPPDPSIQKAGYNADMGLIQGGFFGGQGYQPNGYDLIDGNFIPAKSLDYFNSQAGSPTTIEATMRKWLGSQFVDPSTGMTVSYQGNDRRESLFGKQLDCIRNGSLYYVPGHTLTDSVPIATEIPLDCTNPSKPLGMNTYSMWIEQYYLKGSADQAKQMFVNTVSGYTATPGTGIGGTMGGVFSDQFDALSSCKNSRTLMYWIHMARATGFWKLSDQTRTMAQQIMDELWAHQLSDGGIRVAYPGCGSDRASNESSGLALVAFDPRIPQWFGHQA